jgi:hypothetical protein
MVIEHKEPMWSSQPILMTAKSGTYYHLDHFKYVVNLFEIAEQGFFSGDCSAHYTLALSLVDHHEWTLSKADSRTSLLGHSKAAINALRNAASSLNARTTRVPVRLSMFNELFEYDYYKERGPLLTITITDRTERKTPIKHKHKDIPILTNSTQVGRSTLSNRRS